MAYKIHSASHIRLVEKLPETVDEAVDRLISDLPLRDKFRIANMAESELSTLNSTLGSLISAEFGIHHGNQELLRFCENASGEKPLHPDYAPTVIIRELWRRLRKIHKLRVV